MNSDTIVDMLTTSSKCSGIAAPATNDRASIVGPTRWSRHVDSEFCDGDPSGRGDRRLRTSARRSRTRSRGALAIISPRLFETAQETSPRIWPHRRRYGVRRLLVCATFVIRYAPGEQESLRIHHDVAQVSGSIKLNDGYSGAALVFPRQAFDNSAVGIGEMLVWPSLVTHPHETAQLVSGVKYALTVWFELPSF